MIQNSKKNKIDLVGRVIFKLHYIKLDFFSIFFTFINFLTWRLKGVQIKKNTRFVGFSKVCRYPGSVITIDNGCTFRSDKFSNLIGVNRPCIISTHAKNAEIRIGENCGFSGVTIGGLQSIIIGNNVLAGANVIISDFDWHNVDPLRRKKLCDNSKPVVIEENVFIGVNSIIWKGVTIGKNSVIAANSVVTKNIPENCIAGGNPAKMIRSI
jgi:acetyltransferase-like isoleucine patch superfamily enzyme